jgi:hypothetical protein
MPKSLPQITIQIVLRNPPDGVAFALQRGKDELLPRVLASGADLSLSLTIGVDLAGDAIDVRGPFVQGPRGERFFYVCCGEIAGQAGSPWRRRIKVPLGAIDADLAQACLDDDKLALRAVIAGKAKDGGPPAATVPLIEAWKRVKASAR